MLSRPPAPALAPAPPELEPPQVSSGRIALRIAPRRASHPGEGIPEGIPEGITMEVPDELAERLRHLARARSQPLESLAADLLRRGLKQETRRRQAEDALAGLTPRPREVARPEPRLRRRPVPIARPKNLRPSESRTGGRDAAAGRPGRHRQCHLERRPA